MGREAVCCCHSKSLEGGGGGFAQKEPFKTEFPSVMTVQLFRNFSGQIPLTKLFI